MKARRAHVAVEADRSGPVRRTPRRPQRGMVSAGYDGAHPASAPSRDSGASGASGRKGGGSIGIVLACSAVFMLGVVVNDPIGHRGFMPIDQSIVFDGAWRLLTGQVPIRDFATPNGIVPAVIQAAVFRVSGVSWTSYVAHADILNGLFGVVVLLVLRSVGGSVALSLWYAAASVVVFQPPFGTPFVDQAGFFFGLVAIALALASRDDVARWRRYVVAGVPAALVLSLLSKQIPGAMLVPVVLVICLVRTCEVRRTLRLLGAGAAGVAVLFASILVAAGIAPASVVEHLWTLPAQVGAARLDTAGARLWGIVVPQWSLLTPATVLLGSATLSAIHQSSAGDRRRRALILAAAATVVIGAALVYAPAPPLVRGAPGPNPALVRLNTAAGYAVIASAVAWLVRRLRGGSPRDAAKRSSDVINALAATLVVVCCAFVTVTLNQIENGVSFAFLSLGLLHIAALQTLRGPADAPPGALIPRGRGAVGVVAIGALFTAVALGDVATFQREVNGPRVVHDYRFDAAAATTIGLPTGFDVHLDGPFAYTAADLDRVTTLLRQAGGDAVVFGDTTIVAALAGVQSVSPMLWLDPGLVYPRPGTPGFEDFDLRLAEALRRPNTTTVVVEQAANPWWTDTSTAAGSVSWRNARTWTGMRLSHFPRALDVIEGRLCSEAAAGPFTLLQLCPPP